MSLQRREDLVRLIVEAEEAALASDPEAASELYEALRQFEGEPVARAESAGAVAGACVAFHLGMLARTAGDIDLALQHLEQALAFHAEAGEAVWAARVRCELARSLLAKHEEPCARQAVAQLAAVSSWLAARGSARSEEATGLQTRIEPGAGGPLAPGACVFRREGAVWMIAFEGQISHVPDAKGLSLLRGLLRAPGREVPVWELSSSSNDHDRDDRGEAQRVAVLDPLAIERARVRVTRALRNALRRIDAVHPALGRHLHNALRTGRTCAYRPDPRVPVEWKT